MNKLKFIKVTITYSDSTKETIYVPFHAVASIIPAKEPEVYNVNLISGYDFGDTFIQSSGKVTFTSKLSSEDVQIYGL